MVAQKGLEPSRGCPHYVLNVACIPISPLRHITILARPALKQSLVLDKSTNLPGTKT